MARLNARSTGDLPGFWSIVGAAVDAPPSLSCFNAPIYFPSPLFASRWSETGWILGLNVCYFIENAFRWLELRISWLFVSSGWTCVSIRCRFFWGGGVYRLLQGFRSFHVVLSDPVGLHRVLPDISVEGTGFLPGLNCWMLVGHGEMLRRDVLARRLATSWTTFAGRLRNNDATLFGQWKPSPPISDLPQSNHVMSRCGHGSPPPKKKKQ